MAVQSTCPNCNAVMVVETDMLGRQVRCPTCNSIVVAETSGDATDDANQTWRMRTPEGHIYGPISRREMDEWLQQGRISDDCELSSERGEWRPASDVYVQLRPSVVQPATSQPSPSVNVHPTTTTNLRPHRGTLILVLGIMGWITCPAFSVAAWVMGTADLKEMREGRMDTEGSGTTFAGQVLGMVHSIITIIVMLVIVFGLMGRATLGY